MKETFEEEDVLNAQVAERIRNKRISKGYSLDNMASDLNLSASAYRKVEIGETKLTLTRAVAIAKILDAPLEELTGEKSHREYHQANNDKGTFIGHQEFENYYQENKEIIQKLLDSKDVLIASKDATIKHLEEEIAFLRSQLDLTIANA